MSKERDRKKEEKRGWRTEERREGEWGGYRRRSGHWRSTDAGRGRACWVGDLKEEYE